MGHSIYTPEQAPLYTSLTHDNIAKREKGKNKDTARHTYGYTTRSNTRCTHVATPSLSSLGRRRTHRTISQRGRMMQQGRLATHWWLCVVLQLVLMNLLLELLWLGRHARRKRWRITRERRRDQGGSALSRGDTGQTSFALDNPAGHVSTKRIGGNPRTPA